jgi:hypothetical protein
VFFKRLAIVAAAAFAALSLSVAPGNAAAVPHIWNDSNSVGQCLGTSDSDNTVHMLYCDSSPETYWTINDLHTVQSTQTTGYLIHNNAGLCIAGYGQGASILSGTCNWNDPNEAWRVLYFKTDGGVKYYEISNSRTGYCLSVAGGSTAVGAPTITWICQHTADQLWGGPGTTVY